jgi:hypothetical protein
MPAARRAISLFLKRLYKKRKTKAKNVHSENALTRSGCTFCDGGGHLQLLPLLTLLPATSPGGSSMGRGSC